MHRRLRVALGVGLVELAERADFPNEEAQNYAATGL